MYRLKLLRLRRCFVSMKNCKFAIIMNNTDSHISKTLAALLFEHRVTDVIASPGSRNAPLLIALSRQEGITMRVVIDERSAGFIALGMALTSNKAVALVCTSGSALLNYAPAIAEAYYRRVPLIVISADRPKEWIDQDDSQTIVQPGSLSNYVKRSYDLPVDRCNADRWYANRLINDALLTASNGRQSPVHINIQLSEPLGYLTPSQSESNRVIRMIDTPTSLSIEHASELCSSISSPCRVMIIAGFLRPNKALNQALNELATFPNIVVLTETIANLHGENFVSSIDSTLSSIKNDEINKMRPDVVITLGGALVSRHIKQFLRNNPPREHWHVGVTRTTIDCFQSLTMRVEMNPEQFFPQIATLIQSSPQPCDYALIWEVAKNRAISLRQSFAAKAPWSDFKAFASFIPMIPKRWNVHFSNGTSIRYAQIFGEHHYHRCDCNRGVSGIDGCTSTAIGASLADTSDVTLLVTGDMSAQYDIGALSCGYLSPRFKMIIMSNGGGGIFRFIKSTGDLDILEDYFCVNRHIPFRELAAGYGFEYFEANGEETLRELFPTFCNEAKLPAMLVINTSGDISTKVLHNYFEYK